MGDDALVGGAKAVHRLAPAILAILIAVLGCSTSPAASLPAKAAQLPCPAKPTGALCIRVFAHHLALDDAIGYLVSSEPALASSTWRLVLTGYPCDPGHNVQPRCHANGVYPGPTRRGLPPAETSCRAPANGAVNTTAPGCHDTLAEELATHGDWRGMDSLAQGKPMTFPRPVWLCVSEQVFVSGSWNDPNTAEAPLPLRACAALKSA